MCHEYYRKFLVEEIDRCHSHTISFPIISAFHKILTNCSHDDLIFYGRVGKEVCVQIIPNFKENVPSYLQIQQMSLKNRKKMFLKTLCIELDFVKKCLKTFPDSWHMFVITLRYMSTKTSLNVSFVKSLLICKIILSYIDRKIGFIRSLKEIEMYSFGNNSKSIQINTRKMKTILELIENIGYQDSVKAMKEFLPYFQMDQTRLDRSLLHLMSEFQSCYLHINILNDLFDRPYKNACISKIFNGTFIYNIFSKLKNSNSDLICILLENSPSILICFKVLNEFLENNIVFC